MAGGKRQIPAGMQDTLPGECLVKRRIEGELRQLFTGSGYREVETPILEYYDVLDDPTYGYAPERVWKTFDREGRVLAVRPDSTIPSARLAAGPLMAEELPLRLCYLQSATEYAQDTLSMLCEQPQAGVELMGVPGPEAEAEILLLALETLKRSGLRDFQLELGQTQFFQGLMAEAGLSPAQTDQVRALTEQKNALGIQLLLRQSDVSEDVTRRLMRLTRLFGDVSVLDEAEALTANPLCRSAIANLRALIAILKDCGAADALSIDLGMVHQANYYTGLIFRGQVAEAGQPLLSGGRYDSLPGRFGREMPAVGFALYEKLLLIALERQGLTFEKPRDDLVIAFAPGRMAEAVQLAERERAKGLTVSIAYQASEASLRAMTAAGRAARWVCIDRQGQPRTEEG